MKKLGRRLWSKLRDCWWWLLLVAPPCLLFYLVLWSCRSLDDQVRSVVTSAVCFSGWSVVILLLGVVIGSTLTHQRQAQAPPYVPPIQQNPNWTAQDYVRVMEETLAAEENQPHGADEEARVGPVGGAEY